VSLAPVQSGRESAAYLRGFYDGADLVKSMAERAIGNVRYPAADLDGERAEVVRLTCNNILREFGAIYGAEG
jgi:hypothetical protein